MARCTRVKDSCEARSGPIAIHPAILRIAASANQQIGRGRTKPDARTSHENGIVIPTAAALLDSEMRETTRLYLAGKIDQ
jgi:hypothetical protein